MNRYDEELRSLEGRIADLEHLQNRQKILQQEFLQLENKVRDLRLALRAEERDVEQLEQKLILLKQQKGVAKSYTMLSLMEHKYRACILPEEGKETDE